MGNKIKNKTLTLYTKKRVIKAVNKLFKKEKAICVFLYYENDNIDNFTVSSKPPKNATNYLFTNTYMWKLDNFVIDKIFNIYHISSHKKLNLIKE